MGPDLYGGLLGTGNPGMADFDGQTGSTLWSSNFVGSRVALRTDGNAVGLGHDAQQPSAPLSVFVVNGATGQSSQVPIPERSTLISTSTTIGCGAQNNVSDVTLGNGAVVTTDTDGNAYFEYVVSNTSVTIINPAGSCIEAGESKTIKYKLVLMTVFADGSTSTSQLASRIYTQVGTGGPQGSYGGSVLSPGSANPDGTGGVVATWSESFVYSPSYYMVSHISSSGQSDFHLTALDGMNPSGPSNNFFGTVVLDSIGNGYVASGTGSGSYTIVAFDINSGQIAWTAQPGSVGYMFAQDGGGVIFQSYDASGNPVVKSIDATGNLGPSFSTGSVLTHSWSRQWFSVGPGLSAINLPYAVDQASPWPENLGNPSQNGFGVPGCPCEDQSVGSTLSPQLEASPAAPTAPSLYVQLVRDPGLNTSPNCATDPTHCHNVGQLFDFAASTQAASLTASGSNAVVTDRISSVENFNSGLTTTGTITGGVSYFGHAAQMKQADGSYLSLLAAGQGQGVDTNVSALNVSMLSNSQLGQNIRITLNGCNAGLPPIVGTGHSIAQLIANRLNRPVLAWKVGMFFANDLTARFPKKLDPQSNVIYMLPDGGSGVAACTFTPNQAEPQHCGGVK